jgi:hypothetical protein
VQHAQSCWAGTSFQQRTGRLKRAAGARCCLLATEPNAALAAMPTTVHVPCLWLCRYDLDFWVHLGDFVSCGLLLLTAGRAEPSRAQLAGARLQHLHPSHGHSAPPQLPSVPLRALAAPCLQQ